MKLSELKTLSLYEALERLEEEKDQITTREALKHSAIYHIQNDNIFLAAHILSAINERYADYYDYADQISPADFNILLNKKKGE